MVRGFDFLHEDGPDPTLDAVMEFENGAGGHLHACASGSFAVFEMDLIGTRGRVRIVDSGHTIEYYDTVDSPHYSGYRALALTSRQAGGMHNLLLNAVEDIVRCLEQSEPARPACTGEDGVAALRIAQAIVASAQSGQAIAPEALS